MYPTSLCRKAYFFCEKVNQNYEATRLLLDNGQKLITDEFKDKAYVFEKLSELINEDENKVIAKIEESIFKEMTKRRIVFNM